MPNGFLLGTPAQTMRFPRFTEEQQAGLQQILQQALGGLQQPLGADFEPIAQQARTQFEQRTIPTLAERFTAMGGQRASAFPQALGQAGAGLEEALAGQRAQFGLQQRGLLQNLLMTGLQPQFETAYMPRTPGFLEAAGSPLLQTLGSILPLLIGGRGLTQRLGQLGVR